MEIHNVVIHVVVPVPCSLVKNIVSHCRPPVFSTFAPCHHPSFKRGKNICIDVYLDKQ